MNQDEAQSIELDVAGMQLVFPACFPPIKSWLGMCFIRFFVIKNGKQKEMYRSVYRFYIAVISVCSGASLLFSACGICLQRQFPWFHRSGFVPGCLWVPALGERSRDGSRAVQVRWSPEYSSEGSSSRCRVWSPRTNPC